MLKMLLLHDMSAVVIIHAESVFMCLMELIRNDRVIIQGYFYLNYVSISIIKCHLLFLILH
jgi:hypothetical protein